MHPFRRRVALRLAIFCAAASAGAETIHLTDGRSLFRIDSADPATLLAAVPIEGAASWVRSTSIELDPATGDLVALSLFECNILCPPLPPNAERIDPATGAVTTLAWSEMPFGVDGRDNDLHPRTRELRLMAPGGENLRFSLASEDLHVDTPLDLPGEYLAVAHSPATNGAADVTTWVVRWSGSELELARLGGVDGIPPAASGEIEVVGPLGVAGWPTGFDIAPNGTAYLVTYDYGEAAAGDAAFGIAVTNRLYEVDLESGAATEIGTAGVPPSSAITGLAVGGAPAAAVPAVTPLGLAALAGGVAALGLRRVRARGGPPVARRAPVS
jgi:hypothetical protein